MKADIKDIVRRFLMKEKIKDLKRKQRDMELRYAIRQAKERQAELEKRFNHNHDPKNGRFTSGDGSVLTSGGGGGTIPVRDCAKIRQLTEIDDTAAHILVKGFVEPDLTNHWEGSDHAHSHKDQYKGMTKEQYAQRAQELAEMPVGGNIRGFAILNQNVIVRYDVKNNDFVMAHIHQGVITMFKPDRKADYFSGEYRKEMKNRPSKKKRK